MEEYLALNDVKEVTILGGSISAMDPCKSCVLAGKRVSWVIREDGAGPSTLVKAYTNGVHIGQTMTQRWTTMIRPNAYFSGGFWHWFLFSGRSWLGSKVIGRFDAMPAKRKSDGLAQKSSNMELLKPSVNRFESPLPL